MARMDWTTPGAPREHDLNTDRSGESDRELRGAPSKPRTEPRVVPGAGRIRSEALDPEAVHVVTRLQRMGHEAYLVGGCVRDLLLGLEPKDFDVATDAPPNRIKRVFRNAFIIGRRFRLAHIRFDDGKIVEAATFRRDPGEQGLHPDREDGPIYDDNVFGNAEEDAFRRDFTVNALFYDPTEDRVVDYVGGLEDLETRTIRAIGDPERRLKEDPVRMIRAIHFAARIGGRLEPRLERAIASCAEEIDKASRSRLYIELVKVLGRGSASRTMRTLYELGVLRPWLPELVAFLDRPIDWPKAAAGAREGAPRGEPEDTPPQHLTWNLLGAADAWGMAARGVPESLEMATLFGPWILDEWTHGRRLGPDIATHTEVAFRPIALRMSIPRKVSWELREILWLIDRLKEAPDQRRRRSSLVHRAVFPEALAYYGLLLEARGMDLAPVDRWREIADEVWAHEDRHVRGHVPHPASDFPQTEGEDAPARELDEEPMPSLDGDELPRRRRRRGGRGRGRSSAGGAPREGESRREGGRSPDATLRDERSAPDDGFEPIREAPPTEAPRRPAAPARSLEAQAPPAPPVPPAPPAPPAPRAKVVPAMPAAAPPRPPPLPRAAAAPAAPAAPPAPPAQPRPSAPSEPERPFGSGLR